MKKWVKWGLIGFGVLIALNIIIELTKSPEQREKEERESFVKDSLEKVKQEIEKARIDSVNEAGIDVSFTEATSEMESANWQEVDGSRVFVGDGIRIVMQGDTSNLSMVMIYLDPSTNLDAKVAVLKTLLDNVVGSQNTPRILADIGSTMTKGVEPSSWTIGEKKKLFYTYDRKTAEMIIAIGRNREEENTN